MNVTSTIDVDSSPNAFTYMPGIVGFILLASLFCCILVIIGCTYVSNTLPKSEAWKAWREQAENEVPLMTHYGHGGFMA